MAPLFPEKATAFSHCQALSLWGGVHVGGSAQGRGRGWAGETLAGGPWQQSRGTSCWETLQRAIRRWVFKGPPDSPKANHRHSIHAPCSGQRTGKKGHFHKLVSGSLLALIFHYNKYCKCCNSNQNFSKGSNSWLQHSQTPNSKRKTIVSESVCVRDPLCPGVMDE